ncbi:MAG TPA: hypothetical protein VFX18_03835 [Candidatus Nitrosocosmicus sp.]|nr:hypothetical protein [Candidatus Nitrosocosmicus sp.]
MVKEQIIAIVGQRKEKEKPNGYLRKYMENAKQIQDLKNGDNNGATNSCPIGYKNLI